MHVAGNNHILPERFAGENASHETTDGQVKKSLPPFRRGEIINLIFFSFAYWVSVRLGILFTTQATGISFVWFAGGVALAALLLNPKHHWWKFLLIIFFANILVNWKIGIPLWAGIGFAFAQTLEALVCAWALIYFSRGKVTFGRSAEVIFLFGIAVFGNGMIAIIGAFVSVSTYHSSFTEAWLVWWVSHGLGIMLLTPALVALHSIHIAAVPLRFQKALEMVLLAFILIFFAWLLFGPFNDAEEPILRNYMFFPLLIWIAFRFELRDMASALLTFSAVAIWQTFQGHGIFAFAHQSRAEHFLALQIYLNVVAFSGLLLSAVVSDRRRVEHVLQESRSELATAQLLAHIGHWIWDVSSQTIEWSDEIYRILGVQPQSFTPSFAAFEAAVHPDDLADFSTRRNQMLEDKKDVVFEYRILLPDKTIRFMEERAKLECDEFGKVLRVIGAVQDVTERKHAEEALRASEEKYRTVANFTYDWEAWHAPYGVYLYVSPSCEQITGYTPDEFMKDANLIINITHPDDRFKMVEHFRSTTRHLKGDKIIFDFRIITKGGEMRWINHTCLSVYDDNGMWLGRRESNRDITARKKNESVLRSRLWLSQYADTHSVDDVLQSTLNEAEALTESQIGFFHSLDEGEKMLTLQMWSSNTLQNMCKAEGKDMHYSVDNAGVWADCIYTREPIIYNDYLSLPHRKGLPEGHAPVSRILVVPIIRNDFIVAIFGVGNKLKDYNDSDVKAISQIADLMWDVVLRKRSEEEVRKAKDELEVTNKELETALAREKTLSHTDVLTGIHNRRYLFEIAEREFDFAQRHKTPLSVIMFDLDYFKKVNDTFGHDIGDRVLQCVTQAACAELRSSDAIGRYGGEEFLIILPMTTAQQAYTLAERVRAAVEAVRVPTPKGDALVTLSVGISELNCIPKLASGDAESLDCLIRCADEAMYKSKQAGRNRITIYQME
jgi:diguanylate cyclase (GGDEF)-like protein/PAS domain S-box-containing protein